MRRLCLILLGCLVPLLAAAQSAPAPNATIVKFSALQPNDPNNESDDPAAGSGPLRLTYSDGTVITVPNERGAFSDGSAVVPQTVFEQLQLAADHKTIGWAADYMMCAQSYPCPLQVVIFRAGAPPRKMPPAFGTIWGWMFCDGGRQVVIHSGFPHGDEIGVFTLYDAQSGHELAQYSETANAPGWVRQYLSNRQD